MECADRVVELDSGKAIVRSIESILADKEAPLCVGAEGDTNLTLGTIVMICDPARPRMRVAACPIRGVDYGEYGF
ncbi:MAG: hypothetical protein ACOYM2_00145 [Rectinemataceae bacterium]